ncbi:DUF1653 domain-containing protein [Xylophilus rhododendri]|uniref:DUF1653 domain-containing protein n=1 Tax=Xylophilus rhododendri TaxID=2697032 RepID=A0A857J2I0_9BURK|nr:DUF1653 domain-containing protein [Xylophilus rhododendri]QHI97075.1 DUF1653 domain-containing protein [Xylophilus rhododendri]
MSSQLPPLPTIPLGRYHHYKGGEYEVIGVARHSETLEAFVIYRPLYNATGMWTRPLAMFLEQVEANGEWQPRFRYLSAYSQRAQDRVPALGTAG